MLKLQLSEIRVSILKVIINIEHRYNTHFYLRLNGFVLRQCIQHITKEFERVKRIGADKIACGGFIKTTHMLPCGCDHIYLLYIREYVVH